ncbi:hypothetical protein PEPS_45410 (plasmid) [Persicobacter psychrovividus]|uniref:Uncharacterized protein n=2 Tax=Persicobacter psychrovividus TaxID=387638 RepID=A0ABN6LGJ3_9BACT|nr:hypothetical protein PEPS_45410 [Persicobacter psychrovividus]
MLSERFKSEIRNRMNDIEELMKKPIEENNWWINFHENTINRYGKYNPDDLYPRPLERYGSIVNQAKDDLSERKEQNRILQGKLNTLNNKLEKFKNDL